MKLLFPILCLLFLVSGPSLALTKKEKIKKQAHQRIIDLVERKDDFVGVELMVAAGNDERFYSRWGHALLRFVDNDGIWHNDPIVSFVALIDGKRASYLKGITGSYEVVAEVESIHYFWEKYTMNEERSLERYIIPTTQKSRNQLLETLKDWVLQSKYGQYKFLSNNCSQVLGDMLKDAGLPVGNSPPAIPTNLPQWLDSHSTLPFPKIVVENIKGLKTQAAETLGITPEQFEYGESWPTDAAERLLQNFSSKHLRILFYDNDFIPYKVRKRVSQRVQDQREEFQEIVGFQTLPQKFYQACTEDRCFRNLEDQAQKYWAPHTLSKKFLSVGSLLKTEDLNTHSTTRYLKGLSEYLLQEKLIEKNELYSTPLSKKPANSEASLVVKNEQVFLKLCLSEGAIQEGCVGSSQLKGRDRQNPIYKKLVPLKNVAFDEKSGKVLSLGKVCGRGEESWFSSRTVKLSPHCQIKIQSTQNHLNVNLYYSAIEPSQGTK